MRMTFKQRFQQAIHQLFGPSLWHTIPFIRLFVRRAEKDREEWIAKYGTEPKPKRGAADS
jgi:hypothetical protein